MAGDTRWTRTQSDELLQVLEGSRSVEALRRTSEVGPGSVVGYHERNHYSAPPIKPARGSLDAPSEHGGYRVLIEELPTARL